MVQSSQQEPLDELDITLLRTLQQDGRLSNAELARTINLSPCHSYPPAAIGTTGVHPPVHGPAESREGWL